jgi:hypothetical protein
MAGLGRCPRGYHQAASEIAAQPYGHQHGVRLKAAAVQRPGDAMMRQPAQLFEAAEEVTRLARPAQALLPKPGDDLGIKPQAQDIHENPLRGCPSSP